MWTTLQYIPAPPSVNTFLKIFPGMHTPATADGTYTGENSYQTTRKKNQQHAILNLCIVKEGCIEILFDVFLNFICAQDLTIICTQSMTQGQMVRRHGTIGT